MSHPATTAPRNALAHETSPYLLQHAGNPVDWYPWGDEALQRARTEGKPILLSIGYAACHWCHVMAHESFENDAIAAQMNRDFINIKVDREERPDIDQIYMAALHALGQQGGWPLTMFLTPEGEPFWGGTYFPPESRYGRPGFPEILDGIIRTWRDAPERVSASRQALLTRLNKPRSERAQLGRGFLDAASDQLTNIIDPVLGGPHGAPKFPNPSLLDLVWRSTNRTGDPTPRDLVVLTLRRMCEGGIYDHLGGGFARYSVDDRWLAPHFEKMLYDNAQLLDLLARAHAVTDDPLFLQRIEETIDWHTREMLLPEGAFASSLDADSEGEEGKFYVWTRREIEAVLGTRAAAFCDAYDVTDAGNWEGHVILNRSRGLDDQNPIDPSAFAEERTLLLEIRSKRIRPGLDDKILADWNGLLIDSLARLSVQFDRPDWLALAQTAYGFIIDKMTISGRLAHSYRQGKTVFPGVASDYSAMINAAVSLHEATGSKAYLDDAESLARHVRRFHWDETTGGYFAAASDSPGLILRMKASADEAIPSANGAMARGLIRLWTLTGHDSYRLETEHLLNSLSGEMAANVYATASLLSALDSALEPIQCVIISDDADAARPLLAAIQAAADPRIIMSRIAPSDDLPVQHPAKGKAMLDGKPTLYVCRGMTCSLPITDRIHVKQAITGERIA
jgi:uncharacterized protein YyaL (SSP411 family)